MPSCKLLYVTPERVAGNMSFQEILRVLHRKVNPFYAVEFQNNV